MHDARAHQYTPDAVVEDLEDRSHPAPRRSKPTTSPPIAIGRVPTGELAVHVLHEGHRHRRLPDLSATSCGERYHAQFTPVLREELTHRNGELCRDGCFTAVELAIADRELERLGVDFKP